MGNRRFLILGVLILAAALSRWIPHPPNFAPMTAIALFGGACFADRRLAFAVPLGALLVSDVVLGFYSLMPVVYGSVALTVCLGFWLRTRRTAVPIACAALAGSLLFFILTNLGVWAFGTMYPKTPEGLLACYAAAVPFFRNALLGDLAYTAALFGGLALAEKYLPALLGTPTLLANTSPSRTESAA